MKGRPTAPFLLIIYYLLIRNNTRYICQKVFKEILPF